MRQTILILIAAICLVSCSSESDVSELQEQNKQLETEKAELIKENKQLKIEVDSLKSTIYNLETTLERIYSIINN